MVSNATRAQSGEASTRRSGGREYIAGTGGVLRASADRGLFATDAAARSEDVRRGSTSEDPGFRASTSALGASGPLREAGSELAEDAVLVRAARSAANHTKPTLTAIAITRIPSPMASSAPRLLVGADGATSAVSTSATGAGARPTALPTDTARNALLIMAAKSTPRVRANAASRARVRAFQPPLERMMSNTCWSSMRCRSVGPPVWVIGDLRSASRN